IIASTNAEYVAGHDFAYLTLQIAGGSWIASMVLYALNEIFAAKGWMPARVSRQQAAKGIRGFVARSGFGIALTRFVICAVSLYTNGLPYENYLPDEYVSLLAAKGILKTGWPLFQGSGIYYTRSALFHYFLALVLMIGGSTNPYAIRFVPVIWQLGTIVL